MLHLSARSFVILSCVAFIAVTANLGLHHWRTIRQGPCPPGQTDAFRVIGGYEYTPSSNHYGQCISNQTLKTMLVETPTLWSNLKHAIFTTLRIEKAKAAGNTYHVRQDGGGDCTTIGACLGRLQPGDTLLIHGGTYDEIGLNAPGGTGESSRVTVKGYPGDTKSG